LKSTQIIWPKGDSNWVGLSLAFTDGARWVLRSDDVELIQKWAASVEGRRTTETQWL